MWRRVIRLVLSAVSKPLDLRNVWNYSLTTQCHIPEDWGLHKHRCDDFKCRNSLLIRHFIAGVVEKASLHKSKPMSVLCYRHLCRWWTEIKSTVRCQAPKMETEMPFNKRTHETWFIQHLTLIWEKQALDRHLFPSRHQADWTISVTQLIESMYIHTTLKTTKSFLYRYSNWYRHSKK
jgi:hypothetical protein